MIVFVWLVFYILKIFNVCVCVCVIAQHHAHSEIERHLMAICSILKILSRDYGF